MTYGNIIDLNEMYHMHLLKNNIVCHRDVQWCNLSQEKTWSRLHVPWDKNFVPWYVIKLISHWLMHSLMYLSSEQLLIHLSIKYLLKPCFLSGMICTNKSSHDNSHIYNFNHRVVHFNNECFENFWFWMGSYRFLNMEIHQYDSVHACSPPLKKEIARAVCSKQSLMPQTLRPRQRPANFPHCTNAFIQSMTGQRLRMRKQNKTKNFQSSILGFFFLLLLFWIIETIGFLGSWKCSRVQQLMVWFTCFLGP